MIVTLTKDEIPVLKEQDVILFRNRVKEFAVKIKMGLVNQTKLITAASELVRNMLIYGNGGKVLIEVITKGKASWWYHGAKLPEAWPVAFLRSAYR